MLANRVIPGTYLGTPATFAQFERDMTHGRMMDGSA